jgi:subtilase family serine protease
MSARPTKRPRALGITLVVGILVMASMVSAVGASGHGWDQGSTLLPSHDSLPARSSASTFGSPGGLRPTPAAADISDEPLEDIPSGASAFLSDLTTTLGSIVVSPDPSAYDPNSPDSVTVTFEPSGNLSARIDQQSNVASPQYHQFVSADQIGQEYGSPSYASASAYFGSFGLRVLPSATELTMTVSGTAIEISDAFHTPITAFSESYRSGGVWLPAFGGRSGQAGTIDVGPVVYSNTAPAELPEGIAHSIDGLVGLDQVYAMPDLARPFGFSPEVAPDANNSTGPCQLGVYSSCSANISLYQNDTVNDFLWTDFASGGATCQLDGICGDFQFLFPSTMPGIVGATSLWNGSRAAGGKPDLGQGVTLGLIEVGCAQPADLTAWSAQAFGNANQLLDRLTQIAIGISPSSSSNGSSLADCVNMGLDAGWTMETALDVEYVAAMAPQAHIDVIGIPAPGNLSAFDLAYADVAQFLSLRSTGGSCPNPAILDAAGVYVVQGAVLPASCSVTITSNSYGMSEETGYFYGSPAYVAAQDQELEILNAEGVTNFFSSGDDGGNSGINGAISDSMPAASPGSTSVGGAQVTASGLGSAFPVSGQSFTYCDAQYTGSSCSAALSRAYAVPATGISSAAYWASGEGTSGTLSGVIGGGFGQSLSERQPWWQNSNDSYSSGLRIDPIVSLAAAYNLTVYAEGQWLIFYGGTSFACPTMAGVWALLEVEQALQSDGPEMGDVNPLLFAAHNAYEAGFGATDPYTPMGPGEGYDSSPANSITWAYYNASIEVPSAPVEPDWFASLGNPAGSGWNYLQGLGIPNTVAMSQALFGGAAAPGGSLDLPPLSLQEVGPGGTLTSPTTLVAGTAYTFQVETSAGTPANSTVVAYSGLSNNGTYGGGTTSEISTGANGRFTYTPGTGISPGGPGATTYGYFYVRSPGGGAASEWLFDSLAIASPNPAGMLSLCVVDSYGVCQSSDAQVTTDTTTVPGLLNLLGQSEVYLDGEPVADAAVTQTSMLTQFEDVDPSLPAAWYAPGTLLGTTFSDLRGEAVYWIDAYTSEFNGTLRTDIYQLRATYDGLVSNNVTVFAEPQSGTFYTGNLTSVRTDSGPFIQGNLSFAGMKYVDSVNVSIGSSPGQYENWTCPLPLGAPQPLHTLALPGCAPVLDARPGAQLWESGVADGTLYVDLNGVEVARATPISVEGVGSNDISIQYCGDLGIPPVCYGSPEIQSRLVWAVSLAPVTASSSGGAPGGGPTTEQSLPLLALTAAGGIAAGAAVVYLVNRRRSPPPSARPYRIDGVVASRTAETSSPEGGRN